MTKFYKSILVFLLCIAPALTAYADENGEDDLYFTWISNYDEAMRQAKAMDKPLLLSFRCVP